MLEIFDEYKGFFDIIDESSSDNESSIMEINVARQHICKYMDTKNVNDLVSCGVILSSILIINIARHDSMYKNIEWSRLPEFDHYPILSKLDIYIDLWKKHNNLVFIEEMLRLVAKEYEK